MKKRFTILIAAAVMLLAIMLQPTRLWGQTRDDVVYKETIFNATNNSQKVSGYTTSWYNTTDGFRNDITNANNNNNAWNFIKMGRSGVASTGTIITHEAIDNAITKVSITIDAITANKITSITLYTSTNNLSWTSVGTFAKSTGTKAVSLTSPAANLYYKIEVVCTSGSSNGLITISSVKYYKAGTPTCSVSPSSWDFGSVVAGTTTSTKTFTVTTANLTSALTLEASTGYSVSPTSIDQSETSTNVTVTCTPTVVGTQNGTLTIFGEGLASNVVVNLTATGTCAQAANPLAFDDVNLVLEGVNVSIDLSDLSPTGAGNGGDISYEMSTISGGSLDGSIFTATAVGEYVVTASQELNDIYCSETADINIHVVGTDPVCTIDEEFYDFGEVGVGFSKPQDFTITTLNLTEEITLSVSDGQYSLSQTTIEEDGSTTLTITFTPTTTGVVEADLTISGSDFDNVLLATISGTGIQTYTVSFNPGTGGSGPSSVTNVENYPIILASATASTVCQEDAGWTTFAGWTTATTLANENTAPTPLYSAGSTYNIPNGGATLNAVYSQSNENNGGVTFSESGYADGAEVTGATIDSNVSVSFNKGTNNSNVPKYYSTGTAIRCYGGNYFTVSSTSGNLTTINLSFGTGEGSNTITTNVGTYSNGSWSGTASSVTFTIGGTSGHRRIAGIAVTYGGSTSYAIAPNCIPQVKTPTFSVEEGFYTETKSVSISCETTGATIKYTTDGTTPSESNGLVYSSPVSVAQTTTIKAIAIYEGYDDSEVATATYTINNATHPYTVAQARDAIDADFGLTNVYATGIVSTAGEEVSDGKITYSISDDGNATTELQAYQGKNLNNTDFSSLDDIKVGDVVVIYGTLKKFGSIYEFQSGNYLYSITHTPTIIVSTEAVSDMVSIVGLEGDTDGENWSNAQTFTVSGSNLTHDITLTLSSNVDFEMSTDGSSYSSNPITINKDGDGNVGNTTVYVRLKAGAIAPAAQKTATITIASEDANSKSVGLTGSVTYAELSYDGNGSDGGTVPTDGNSYTYNSEVTVADATMTRTGYGFVCWNTQLDGQGTNSYDPEETFNITASTTLYAQWVAKNYIIAKATMVGGSVAVKVDDSEVFQAGTGSVVTLVVTPASNYTLATLTVNAGTVALSPTVSPSVLTYTFTMPANDVTVAATFTKDPYTWNLAEASYDDVADPDIVTWSSDYATMTNSSKSGGTSASNYLGGDSNNRTSSRFYKDNILTIKPADNYKINSVVFTATSTGYATALQGSTWTNATADNTTTTVTITPTDRTTAVSATIGGTCGFTEVKVYYEFYIPVNGSSEMTGDVTIPEGEIFAVTSTIKIIDGQTLTVNGTLINTIASNLVIKDGGQLKVYATGAKDGGVQATVEKNITGYGNDDNVKTGWNFIASPLTSAYTLTGTDMVSGTYDLYRLNNTIWENYENSEHASTFTALENGTGYLYANSNDITLSFAGAIKPFTTTGGANEVALADGWNLVGNPYTFNVYSSKSYYVITTENNKNIVTAASNEAIAPCTGIVIKSTGEDNVTFSDESAVWSTGNNGNIQMVLAHNVNVRGDKRVETIDNAIVSFNEGSQLEKFYFGNPSASIYIPQNGEDYAIAFSDRQGDVPLYFKANETGTYTISFAGDEMSLNGIYLIDILAEEEIDLSVNPSYTFIGSPADRMARFKIVFRNTGGDGTSDIFAYQNGNDIIVSGEGELQIFDVMGRMVSRQRVNGVETVNAMPYGVYILKLNGMTQKIVVR